MQKLERSTLFGTQSAGISRSRSCEFPKLKSRNLKRACSASLDSFSDEEFSKKISELAIRFQLSDGNESSSKSNASVNKEESTDLNSGGIVSNFVNESAWRELQNWSDQAEPEMIPASIERKANSVDLPVSLRMIQRKLQWKDGVKEAGESAYCSVKKAFSSTVFIIRELSSYTLQMRGAILYEDLQSILVRVQKEIHASFVWLFQQVFSQTPTLMVYVMILLANYSVYSIGSHAALAASPRPSSYASVVESQDQKQHKFDSSTIKTFSVSSTGKTASIGGNNGGGGKIRPVASGTDGGGWFDNKSSSDHFRTVLPDGVSHLSSYETTREAESTSGQLTSEEELNLWNSIVDEASKMQFRDEALDTETIERIIAPLTVRMEPDNNYTDYFKTDLVYQLALREEPNNALLLANYAQFLLLVPHDLDRAEEYFKKATQVEPVDAEAYNKYAHFLWTVKKDLWAAEETYLEAISADPTNSFYSANYAHFLWNTGGEDTCFPLDDAPDTAEEA